MSAAIICSSCNRPLRVPESVLGQTVQCPLCMDEFLAEADPAAEAAARAAEPPVKRSAPKPQLVAAHVQTDLVLPPLPGVEKEIAEVEPIAEIAPPLPAPRPAGEQRAFVFPVFVTRDPDRVLRGRMDGELTAQGLYLRKMRQPPAFAAVGCRARYLGGNRLVVTLEGREVELTVVQPRASTYHLARDTAAFLNGKGGFPQSRSYKLPWYLYVMPAAFIALPVAGISLGLMTDGCLGAFLWCLIAVALAGATLIAVLQAWLRPRARLITAASLVGVGAAIFLISIPLSPSYTVDASLWRTYTSPNGDFHVLVPGQPRVSSYAGSERYIVDVKSPDVSFAVFVAPESVNPNGNLNFGNNNWQKYSEAKTRLEQAPEYAAYNLYYAQELDTFQSGQTCHELIYSHVTSRYGYSNKENLNLVARIVVANGKVYTLAVLGPRVRADGPDVLKFFLSFQPQAGPAPVETTAEGKVVRVQQDQLVVALPTGEEKTYTVPANTQVLIDGHFGGIADVPPGGSAIVTLKGALVAKVEVTTAAGAAPISPNDLDSLLAYWSFDEPIAPIQTQAVQDNSGNGNAGTAHMATSIAGRRGTAIHFSGGGSYFDFNKAPGLNINSGDAFSYCGWVRTRNVLANGIILSNRSAGKGAPVLDVKIERGALMAEVRQDGNEFNPAVKVVGKVVTDGEWHHFAVTRHCLNGIGVITLFIDGAQQGSQPSPFANGAITTDLRSLGREQYWIMRGMPGYDFTGDIDEFCIFDRALEIGDVKKLAGVAP